MLTREMFEGLFLVEEGATALLKAKPVTEGDDRFVFIEPSNENRDSEGDRVLQKALIACSEYFLKFGNIDIEHRTNPAVAKVLQLKYPRDYEIGRPVEVKTTPHLMVKAMIYRGHEVADKWWNSVEVQRPPMPWWPSVGGAILAKSASGVVTKAFWNNIGFAPYPINRTVPQVTTVAPPEYFLKALTAGSGSDSAALTGGAALRRESLHGARGARRRPLTARLIKAIQSGVLGGEPKLADVHQWFVDQGVDAEDAPAYAEFALGTIGRAWRRARTDQPQIAA